MTNKYLRTIYGVDKEGNAGSLQVDVYDILDAYPTRNPALDHLVKKALCPGHKDLLTDLDDIIKSAQRAKQMAVNRIACTPEVTLHASPEDVRDVKAILEGNQEPERIVARRVSAAPPASAAATRPTCFDGKVLCYYPDKLQAEGILKTFQTLAQNAGIATKAVSRADAVEADCILVDGPNPTENVIRRFMDKEIFLYGVREANVILRGHLACQKQVAVTALEEAEPDEPLQGQPARGYKMTFDTRPTSFIGASIYILEGIDEEALARLEHEIAQVDVIPDWVRGPDDCPDWAIVIRPNNPAPIVKVDHRWYYSVDQAIKILVNDQKGNDNNA